MATRKRRKKVSTSKSTPTKKRASFSRDESKLKDDPIFKLNPYDVIAYTPIAVDGSKLEKEIHVILPTVYSRDRSKVSFYDTIEIRNEECFSNRLYCMGDDACEVEVLSNYEVEQSFHGGKVVCKLRRKRRKRVCESVSQP